MQLPSGTHQISSSQQQPAGHSRTESSGSGTNVQQQTPAIPAQQTNESKELPKPDNSTSKDEEAVEPTETTTVIDNSSAK